MSAFPITGRFVGDFMPLLVAVDTDDTMDQVAEKVAAHSVGIRIARPAVHHGYDVILDGDVVAASTTLGQLLVERELLPMKWFDVRFRTV